MKTQKRPRYRQNKEAVKRYNEAYEAWLARGRERTMFISTLPVTMKSEAERDRREWQVER